MSAEILRAGVMGWPISHSKSPRLHGHWLAKLGVNGVYLAVDSRPEAFADDLRRLVDAGWRGVNVTLPHKETALRLADGATDRAAEIGAANTLVFGADGVMADNTDGFGFLENLKSGAGSAWSPTAPAVVLGAGGASRAVVSALLGEGAEEIRVINRTIARAEALRAAFGDKVKPLELGNAPDALPGAGLIVNTTSLGMKGQPPLRIDLSKAERSAVATDIVYAPLETPFLEAASLMGMKTVDGLGMLLHQARPGFEAWFGVEPVVDDDLRRAVLET